MVIFGNLILGLCRLTSFSHTNKTKRRSHLVKTPFPVDISLIYVVLRCEMKLKLLIHRDIKSLGAFRAPVVLAENLFTLFNGMLGA